VTCRKISTFRAHATTGAIEKPAFLDADIWNGLTTPLVMIRKVDQLDHLRLRRELGMFRGDTTMAKDQMSAIDIYMRASGMKATNPKDHIYGLVGVTGAPIIPDYSEDKLLADVYCEYVEYLLEGTKHGALDAGTYPLIFLSNAGTGLFAPSELPTWAPNYPAEGRGGISTQRFAKGGPGNDTLFGDDEEGYPYVKADTRNLLVWGVKVDKISMISEVPDIKTFTNGWLLLTAMRVGKNEQLFRYNIPPLQAFFRLFQKDLHQKTEKTTIVHALAFLRFLVSPYRNPAPDVLVKGYKFLGLDLTSDDFEEQFRSLMFPGCDFAALGLGEGIRSIVIRDLQGPMGTVWAQCRMGFFKLYISWRYFETEGGYMGLVPKGAVVGDGVYLLKHCHVPVVLRDVESESYKIHIGTTFVVGMMNGELADFIKAEDTGRQWLELR
jgi:hypothetical protein